MKPVSLAVVLGALVSPAPAQSDFTWHTDFTAARKLAADEGKPLLVVFRCEP